MKFDDLITGIFGGLDIEEMMKPKNPWLASLPMDTRIWLAKATAKQKAKEATR